MTSAASHPLRTSAVRVGVCFCGRRRIPSAVACARTGAGIPAGPWLPGVQYVLPAGSAASRHGFPQAVDGNAEHEDGGAGDHGGHRQRERESRAARQAEHGHKAGWSSFERGQSPYRSVGDGVVGQHTEGGETDRPRTSTDAAKTVTTAPTTSSARWGIRKLDGGQDVRQVTVPCPGEGGTRDAGGQCEKRPERRNGRADTHDGSQTRDTGGAHCVSERRCTLSKAVRPQRSEHAHGNSHMHLHIHNEGGAQRESNRAGNGAAGISNLFTKRRGAGVTGEGEEQQPGASRRRSWRCPCPGALYQRCRCQAGSHHCGKNRDHHSGDRNSVGLTRPRVEADGQSHRSAGRGPADGERPAGQISSEVTQALTAAHIGPPDSG